MHWFNNHANDDGLKMVCGHTKKRRTQKNDVKKNDAKKNDTCTVGHCA